jgi:hypothetical protein
LRVLGRDDLDAQRLEVAPEVGEDVLVAEGRVEGLAFRRFGMAPVQPAGNPAAEDVERSLRRRRS